MTTWRELYYDDAQSLAAKYDLVNRLGPSRRGDVGPRLRRRPSRAQPGHRGQVRQRHDAHRRRGSWPCRHTQPGGTFPVSWTGGRRPERRRCDRRAGGGRRRPVDGLADRDDRDERDVHGLHAATPMRSASARPTARATSGAWDVSETGTAPPALAPGGFARVVVNNLSVRAAPRSRCPASHRREQRHARGDHRRPGRRRAATRGSRSPSRSSSGRPSRPCSPASGWRPVPGRRRISSPPAPPNTTIAGTAGPDTQPPSLDGAAVNRTVLSPNGDGRLDTVTVTAPAIGAAAWRLTVASAGAVGRRRADRPNDRRHRDPRRRNLGRPRRRRRDPAGRPLAPDVDPHRRRRQRRSEIVRRDARHGRARRRADPQRRHSSHPTATAGSTRPRSRGSSPSRRRRLPS